MSSPPPLVQDRTTIQQYRATLDHRESVTTTVRMLRSVVRTRAERLGRDAGAVRSDDAILDYLDDLLDVHAGGGPGLGFLAGGLSNYVGEYRSGSGTPGDTPEIVTKYDRLDPGQNRDPFPVELAAYVSGSGSRSDTRAAFAEVLRSDDADRMGAMRWFLDQHLHPLAREGVETTESNLQTAREDHVNHLRRTDDPTNGTDPLEVLDWDDPVAMLPVRLETKFDDATPSGGTLKVRVYPDQIHVDTHEPELTEAEYEWGTEFWAQVWFVNHDMTADPDQRAVAVHDGTPPGNDAAPDRLQNDRLRRVVADLYDQIATGAFSRDAQERFEEVRDRAWGRGVEQFGTERAAYVVRELSPTHQGSTIGDELLAGPDADHWRQEVDEVAEFDELPAETQKRVLLELFVTLDREDKERLLRATLEEAATEETVRGDDKLETFEGVVSESDQDERGRLLARIEASNSVDQDDVEDLLADRTPAVRRPPSLRFPEDDVEFRPASWTRPPRARLLPDRWVVYAYWDHQGPGDVPNLRDPNSDYSQWSENWQPDGTQGWRRWDPEREQWVKKVTGPAIREPLSVGPRPESVAGKSRDGEAGMEWMLDFAEAKTAGMGLELSNPSDGSWDGTPGGGGGYDELVVTGLRTSGDPTESAAALEDLLAAQEYTQGLSVLQQGTPTNNADEPSGRSSSDDAAASAPIKVGDPLVPLDGADLDDAVPLSGDEVTADGTRLANALGVPTDRFAHVENADTTRHVDAGHANDALWPATWGYYARNMLVPEFWNTVLGGQSRYTAQTEALGWLDTGPETEATASRVLSGWLAKFRDHFRDHVRGGGPLQTLQVGAQPYGVLPATPLSVDERASALDVDPLVDPVRRGESTGGTVATSAGGPALKYLDPESLPDEVLLTKLVDWVSTLQTTWLRSADGVPRVGDGTTTDQELLDLLSMEATPRTLRRQSWLLDDVSAVWQLFDQNGNYQRNVAGSRRRPRSNGGSAAMRDRNLSHLPAVTSPRVASMRFYGQSGLLSDEDDLVDDALPRFLRALRGTLDGGLYDPLQGDTADAQQWLDRLRALGGYWRMGWGSGMQFASPDLYSPSTSVETPQRGEVGRWDDLVDSSGLASAHDWLSTPGDLSTSASVLRTLLHFATLREVAATRLRLGALYLDPLEMDPDPATYLDNETIYQELLADLGDGQTSVLANHAAISGSTSRPTYADAVRAAADDDVSPPIDQFLARFGRSLDHLSAMDTDDAEERAMESLGLASHRLDAWWTSIATRRLHDVRTGRQGSNPSDGTLIGAFGYVEDLAPEPGETGEYLLAPSQNQVTTAAVLRSAHRAADDPAHADSLAVDLSAERVQRARTLLGGVRNGRSVSDILGHRFEHRLRELTEASDEPNLRQYRGDFRAAAPSKGGPASHRKQSTREETGHSARSDVVDGRALLRAWQRGTLWGKSELSDAASNPAVVTAVDSVLSAFEDWMDAVNDVLTAEAVHQLSKGNPERATAALEGLSRGKQLPQLEVLRTPRRESGVNNRLMVLFGDGEWRDPSTGPPYDSQYALRKWRTLVDRDDVIDPADLPDLGQSGGQQSQGGQQGQSSRSAQRTVGVRHVGEPNLNGWVGELLPQPDRVRCEASFHWTEDRTFETGTFETPTEPGVVSVTDVGFEPDVLVFRVSNAPGGLTGNPTNDVSGHAWTHGVFHAADGAHDQASTSVAASGQGSTEYATSDTHALSVAVPDDPATGVTVRGEVDATLDDGFQVAFDATGDRSLIVQYQAIKTGDESAVRVGQFTTDAVSSAPATQTVELDTGGGLFPTPTPPVGSADFDPDHLVLSASNAVRRQNQSGTVGSTKHPGSLVGFCHGEAVDTDDGIDQQAVTSALDTAGDDGHAVGFQGDAALELLYGSGDGVTDVTTARVTALGQDSSGKPRFELEYQPTSAGTGLAGEPAVVTYVAVDSPTTEDPVETTHRPAVGYVAAPDEEGDTVTIDPGFDPACLEVMACPGVTASPGTASGGDGSPLTVRTTSTGTAGWSHGVATGVADQAGLSEAVRPVLDDSTTPPTYDEHVVGIGSGTRLVTVPYLDDEGNVAGRDVGRLTAMDDGGVTVKFSELHSESESERPVLYYRAWPTAPEELGHATEASSVPLESLDLSPLDAVSLSQVDARPGLSQLEQRLRYYLFRHRPANQPPVPDDADLELTFAETGTSDDTHVSFAEYLEAARSIRELLGEGRPVDAEDLTHPSEADGPGYLPAGSPDESATASELRERADEVEDRIDDARAIVDNRHELLDVGEDERNVCDQVDAIDRAVETFCREVPARQVHEVADRLDDVHDPANGPTLLDELGDVLPHLRAGPATAGAVDDEVLVETGQSGTVELETSSPGTEFDVTARPHSPGEHFTTRTWTVTADGEGTVEITFDATGITPGTRFTVVGRRTSRPLLRPLDPTLERHLRAVASEERQDLIEHLEDDGHLQTDEVDAIGDMMDAANVSEFRNLPVDDQVQAFLQLDREDKLAALAGLGQEDLADQYPNRALWTVLADELRTLSASERESLLEELDDRGWLDDSERDAVDDLMDAANVSDFENLSLSDQLRAFEQLHREDKIVALDVLGREDAVSRHALPPLSDAVERRVRHRSPAERQELVERLRSEDHLTESDAERIDDLKDAASVDEFRDLPLAEQLRAFELLERAGRIAVLRMLERNELASWYAARGAGPPLVATGRVLEPADGGTYTSAALDGTVEPQALVPRLLWLNRHVDEIRPTDGTAGQTLSDALDHANADWGQIGKEQSLMSTIKPQVPEDAFGQDDFAAVQRLTELQHVDLSASTGLTGKLESAIEPLDVVGLTELVGCTGPRGRPDAQRHWKADDCSVGDLWERPCEGSVRARLRNLLRAPGWTNAPETFGRFAPEFQHLLTGGNLQPEHVFVVDTVLRHPRAFVEAMDGTVDDPALLLQDLNELCYHPTALADRVSSGGLRTRLESFRDWLDTGSMPAGIDVDANGLSGLVSYLQGSGVTDLVRFVGRVGGMAPNQPGSTHASQYESDVGTDLATLRGTSGAQGSTQHTIADRIAPAYGKDDLGPPFRRGVLETLRRGLLRASYAGVYGSTPNSTAGGTPEDQRVLLDQAEVVAETLAERLDHARTVAQENDSDAVATQVDRLEALLGEEFVVLPPFAPSNPAELAHTFGNSDDLLDGDPYAVDTWLQRVSRVRDHPAGFREALTYADLFDLAGDDDTAATGGSRDSIVRRSLTVGQFPNDGGTGGGTGASWVGLDGVQPSGGELSMAALFVSEASGAGQSPVSTTAGSPAMAGLFVDEWVTKVPASERNLGVGFRYDDPDARAPQSVVLAVPPSWSRGTEKGGLQPTKPQTWSTDTLLTTLEETTDLARARSVDLDGLDALGHVLPAACFPHNENSDVVPYDPEVFLPDAPSVLLDTFDWNLLE